MTEQEVVSGKQADDKQPKHSDLLNIGYVENEKVRTELIEIIDELLKIEGISLTKISRHDLSVKYKGRQIVKICPLRKRYSTSLNGGKVQTYSKKEILEAVIDEIAKQPKVEENGTKKQVTEPEDVIELLEERISKMGKKSKGINISGVKISKPVSKWAKEKGFTLTGDTLLVN
ncbi:MAG: hypothetical protein ACXABJ_09295 [Candidatus Heimdallarchaeaceae archaeon]|jgi:hypothetical protein